MRIAAIAMRCARDGAACLSVAISVAACNSEGTRPIAPQPKATFGVFFGSQIQQRRDIPLVANEAKQRQGYRIQFPSPNHPPIRIDWELNYPTKRVGSRGPGSAPRAIRRGTATLPSMATELEQTIPFLPGDVPGTWNLRLLADGETIMDRAFRVVSPNPHENGD